MPPGAAAFAGVWSALAAACASSTVPPRAAAFAGFWSEPADACAAWRSVLGAGFVGAAPLPLAAGCCAGALEVGLVRAGPLPPPAGGFAVGWRSPVEGSPLPLAASCSAGIVSLCGWSPGRSALVEAWIVVGGLAGAGPLRLGADPAAWEFARPQHCAKQWSHIRRGGGSAGEGQFKGAGTALGAPWTTWKLMSPLGPRNPLGGGSSQ